MTFDDDFDKLHNEMFPEHKREDPDQWKEYFDDAQKKFISKKLGDDIMCHIAFKTIKGSGRIYRYNNGVYVDDGRELIQEISKKRLHDKFSSHRVNETIAYIQASTYVGADEINNGWINLENGLLNIQTKEFREHTPHIFTIIRVPIIYDIHADCPFFKSLLKDKVSQEIMDSVQEMFGYCFQPLQKYERAFLLYGAKRTMKSTTLWALTQILGHENMTAFSLQKLTEDTFAPAYLYGKFANICADLDSQSLKNTGQFMMITGGDKITAGKKHEHHVSFYPSAKLIFSCNLIPATTNKDLSFYRRWLPLQFNKQTQKENVDVNMREKIRKELPGILNWALEGLDRLEKNGDFTLKMSDDDIKDIYEKNSNSIQTFIYHVIDIETSEGAITKREAYAKYVDYCKNNQLKIENQIYFGRMFKALTGCGEGRLGELPCYKGVNWIEREEKKEGLSLFAKNPRQLILDKLGNGTMDMHELNGFLGNSITEQQFEELINAMLKEGIIQEVTPNVIKKV